MKKIKIGTIVNSLVGKTSICKNYLGDEFSADVNSRNGEICKWIRSKIIKENK